jgi:hypothetical protein
MSLELLTLLLCFNFVSSLSGSFLGFKPPSVVDEKKRETRRGTDRSTGSSLSEE